MKEKGENNKRTDWVATAIGGVAGSGMGIAGLGIAHDKLEKQREQAVNATKKAKNEIVKIIEDEARLPNGAFSDAIKKIKEIGGEGVVSEAERVFNRIRAELVEKNFCESVRMWPKEEASIHKMLVKEGALQKAVRFAVKNHIVTVGATGLIGAGLCKIIASSVKKSHVDREMDRREPSPQQERSLT